MKETRMTSRILRGRTMKRLLQVTAAFSLVPFIVRMPVFAQFEGIVESRNLTVDETDKPQQFSMMMWIGKGKMRVHNSAIGATPPSTIIYRNDKGVFWVLNDEEKSYIEVLQNPEPRENAGLPGQTGNVQPAIKKTGKKKSILGYQCEQYMVKRPGEQTEIWGTKRLSGLISALASILDSTQQEGEESWNDELTKMGVFPLLATTKVDGNVIESQEVTKVEMRTLAQELFELPAGYRRESVEGGANPPFKR
jgi:hypothetical protein